VDPVKPQPVVSVRKARAAATRRRMLDAAIRCFTATGYSGTTMAQIAENADVAVQTLYFTFHTKAELLQETFDRAVLGDDAPVPPHLTAWHMTMEAEPSLRAALEHLVKGVTAILERVAPLRPVFDAALAEKGVADVWARGERLREEGYRNIVQILARKRPLRTGDLATATDVLLVLLGPDTFRAFVEGREWSVDQWKAWVAPTLERELFESVPEASEAAHVAPSGDTR
jgi:AcrR family transcriptional regulator